MAYETSTATDINDLITKLMTFAVANGWTQDQLATGSGQAALHKNDVYVSFRWSTSSPNHVAMFQALGYTGGNAPGNHPNDSGIPSSIVAAPLNTHRGIGDLGNGAFTYFFFAGNEGGREYLHAVVKKSDNTYRHFGFGELVQFGDWTGGEYCYGTNWQNNNNQLTTTIVCGLDGGIQSAIGLLQPTIRLEGLPYFGGTTKWGVISGTTSNPGNDRGGNPRVSVQGGTRGGPLPYAWAWLRDNSFAEFVPNIPIELWLYRPATASVEPAGVMKLGRQPHAAFANIRNYTPEEEKTVSGEVWKYFPMIKKQDNNSSEESANAGLAYRKIT